MKTSSLFCVAATLLVGLIATSCGLSGAEEPIKGPRAVVIDIQGDIPFSSQAESLLPAMADSQRKLEKLLEQAASDLMVQEIAVHIGPSNLGLARAAELGQAIAKASQAGKPLSCHLDAADNATYWMAVLGCPEIVLSPAGEIAVLGLSLEAFYLKELLDSMGVKAEMLHVGKYKDAAEPLTSTGMSEDTRQAYTELLGDLHQQLVAAMAEKRKLDPAEVQKLMDTGPHDSAAALEHRLVDRIATFGAHLDSLRGKYEGGVDLEYGKAPREPLSLSSVFKALSDKPEAKDKPGQDRIAIVSVIGTIAMGRPQSLFDGENTAYDAEIVETLSEAAADDTVKAVVLRIDSPGGSALASDNIWHAVRAVAARKPVIASMADTAASGGYYIASAAKEIIAGPTTITGSIGVVGGKMVLAEAAQKLGVRAESVRTGARAGLESAMTGWTDEERGVVLEMMTRTYDMFISRVAEGRGLEPKAVRLVAEGRVWTGSQALNHKLIDRIGTGADALVRARELAGLPAGVKVDILPEPKSFFDSIGDALSESQDVRLRLVRRSAAGRAALGLARVLADERVVVFAPLVYDIH